MKRKNRREDESEMTERKERKRASGNVERRYGAEKTENTEKDSGREWKGKDYDLYEMKPDERKKILLMTALSAGLCGSVSLFSQSVCRHDFYRFFAFHYSCL